jgi:hypothetical protein
MDIFLRPLFHQEPSKIYNLNKSMELQRPIRKKKTEETEEVIEFGDKEWQEEMLERQRLKLQKYEKSLAFIIDKALDSDKGNISLLELSKSEENLSDLIPNVDIFKEIMVELIKSRNININDLRKEKSEYITEQTYDFQLNEMLLKLADENEKRRAIIDISIVRLEDTKPVEFKDIPDEKGEYKIIKCSNVLITVNT